MYNAIAKNFSVLFTAEGSQYQSRPLYVLFPFVITNLLKNLSFFGELSFFYELSFLISQLIISVFTLNILINVIKKYYTINTFEIFSISLIYFMNPVQQFVMFTTSNGTTSFTMLVLSIYFLEKFIYKNNIFSVCFIIGILFLVNRSFIVTLIVFLLTRLFTKKVNFKNLKESFIGFVIFWIPVYLYRTLIKLSGYEVADTNVVDYGQFVWVSKYFDTGLGFWISKIILSKKNFELRLKTDWNSKDEWYCQNIPENFLCYIEDIWLSSIYLFIPLLLIIFSFIFSSNLDKTLIRNFLITGSITMFFWSFIGWYPPLRFGLYSFGNILMLLSIFYYVSFKNKKIKVAYIFTIFFGLLNISHWNNPNLLELTYLDYISFIFLFIFFYILINQREARSG